MSTPAEECKICEVAEQTASEDIVHRGAHFTVATGMHVPGWLLLWSHRHEAQGLWELTDAESAELGALQRDLAVVLRQKCAAERIYVMAMGEHALHFHAMVMARSADIPPEGRGPGMLGTAATLADPDRARAIAGQVRAALMQQSPLVTKGS